MARIKNGCIVITDDESVVFYRKCPRCGMMSAAMTDLRRLVIDCCRCGWFSLTPKRKIRVPQDWGVVQHPLPTEIKDRRMPDSIREFVRSWYGDKLKQQQMG